MSDKEKELKEGDEIEVGPEDRLDEREEQLGSPPLRGIDGGKDSPSGRKPREGDGNTAA